MKEMLLIQITSEELKELIKSSLKEVLSEIKEELKPQDQDTIITRMEAAKLLKINLPTLYHWSKEGRLRNYKIGNRVYYKRKKVLESLDC